jgi:hypothetical protein
MQQMVLLIENKTRHQCTFDDAELLDRYAGLVPDTNKHATFTQRAMN